MDPASVEHEFAQPIELRPPALGPALRTTTGALRWIREELQEGYHDAFEDAERLLVAANGADATEVARAALVNAVQRVGLLRDGTLPARAPKPFEGGCPEPDRYS